MANTDSRSRLGKGLGALLGEYLDEQDLAGTPVREVEVASVRPNPFQPRREIDDDSLAELEKSIEEHGLLQPLVVRQAGREWELVAGERRWRVLKRLGWKTAPTVVRELSDEQMLVLALVENLQREELGPLEEAAAYQQLVEGFGLSRSEVARRVGRDRSTVANALRLLTLPLAVRALLDSGELTAGHARAILSLEGEEQQMALAREVAARELSVRQTESRARRLRRQAGAEPRRKTRDRGAADAVARRAETLLSRRLGTDVRISLRSRTAGEFRIPFRDAQDFERLARLLLTGDDTAGLFGN